MSRGLQQARDSISTDSSTIAIPNIFTEQLRLWEEPAIIYDKDIDNSFILGHSVNGVLGTATGLGGGQVVLGNTNNFETLLRIQPASDSWVNFLRSTPTNGTAYGLSGLSSGTATTATTYRLDLASGGSAVWFLAKNSRSTYSRALPFIDEDADRTNMVFTGGSANTVLSISPDNSTWQAVTNKADATLTTPSSTLYFKIAASGTATYWKTADSRGYDRPMIVQLR